MRESLLNIEELAEWIGKTPKSIYDLRYRGDPDALPLSIEVGGSVRYDPADVREWFREKREEARREQSSRTAATRGNYPKTRTRSLPPASSRLRVQVSLRDEGAPASER